MITIRTVVLPTQTRAVKGFLGAVAALGIAMVFMLAPGEIPLMSCPFHDLTGYSCFTCGLTRSLHALSNGDLLASFRFHLLGPFLLAGMLLVWVHWAIEAATGKVVRPRTPEKMGRSLLYLLAAVWGVYGFVRLVVEVVG
ncbi:MAG: DUF2752 domain-containing protein [Bacteroidetes bacterium]|nr:DUF2752 domain-containing protein [Bacteroidota bacterium]